MRKQLQKALRSLIVPSVAQVLSSGTKLAAQTAATLSQLLASSGERKFKMPRKKQVNMTDLADISCSQDTQEAIGALLEKLGFEVVDDGATLSPGDVVLNKNGKHRVVIDDATYERRIGNPLEKDFAMVNPETGKVISGYFEDYTTQSGREIEGAA